MLLAIDTASNFMSIALHDGQRILAEYTQHAQRQQTVQLAARVDELLRGQDIQPSALTAIGIAEGPGMYSGLRVGFGMAKGLATALSIPLIPIPTLDIWLRAAFQPLNETPISLAIILQAGRRRIITGLYAWHRGQWVGLKEPFNTTWAELLALLTERKEVTLLMGEMDDEALKLLQAQPQPILTVAGSLNLRRAGFLADLAWEQLQSGNYERDLARVNPRYLKEP